MELIKTTILGLFFGTFGTTLGGLLGIFIKKNSNKFLSFILSLASGLMMAVVCFDLIPEALNISGIINVMIGILIGIIAMIFCDVLVEKNFNQKTSEKNSKSNSLLKTGMIVSIGLAIHNFPEGLAIGSGFEASIKLGLSLAIAICLHDIPEGISMAVPMKNGGMKNICNTIRNNNRNRSVLWSNCWINIRTGNSYMPKLCSRCDVIYCIRRANTRI